MQKDFSRQYAFNEYTNVFYPFSTTSTSRHLIPPRVRIEVGFALSFTEVSKYTLMGIKVENSSPFKSTKDYIKKDVDTLFFQRYCDIQLEQQRNRVPLGLRILRDFYTRNKERSIGRFRPEFPFQIQERPIWKTNKMAVTAAFGHKLKTIRFPLIFFPFSLRLLGLRLVGHTCLFQFSIIQPIQVFLVYDQRIQKKESTTLNRKSIKLTICEQYVFQKKEKLNIYTRCRNV